MCIRDRLQKSKFASWRPWRALFLCFPQCVGITLFMNFKSPSSYSIWVGRVPQIRFRGKFVFQDPPLRKCTLFLLDDSSAGMGTIIFHQNHKKSFGITKSNMKTFALSKIDHPLLRKSHFILQNKRFGGLPGVRNGVIFAACHLSSSSSAQTISLFFFSGHQNKFIKLTH